MTIREAKLNDVDALVRLHATGFEAGWDAASLAEFVQNEIVLVIGEPVMGFIIVRQTLDEAEIMTLVVDPGVRRSGRGALLLVETLNRLAKSGTKTVFLEVASENEAAIGLYQRTGFSQIGLRKAYYSRQLVPPIDAIVMSQSLASPYNCS
jgi:[ribosomal protein S18]-alanine N-acetyltransferase